MLDYFSRGLLYEKTPYTVFTYSLGCREIFEGRNRLEGIPRRAA